MTKGKQIQQDLEGNEAREPLKVSFRPQIIVAIENSKMIMRTTTAGLENLKDSDEADPEAFVQSRIKIKAGQTLDGTHWEKQIEELLDLILENSVSDLEKMATKPSETTDTPEPGDET